MRLRPRVRVRMARLLANTMGEMDLAVSEIANGLEGAGRGSDDAPSCHDVDSTSVTIHSAGV